MDEQKQPDPPPKTETQPPQAQPEARTTPEQPAPDLVLTAPKEDPAPHEKAEEKKAAPKKPKKKPEKAEQIDPAELERLAKEYEALKQSHESLTASLQSAQSDRRLQVMRSAGVEVLGDEELLKLAPQVDPDTTEGRQKINEWIESHQGLVSPRFKIQPKRDAQIASSAIENAAVKTLFGNAETVRKRIKTLMGD